MFLPTSSSYYRIVSILNPRITVSNSYWHPHWEKYLRPLLFVIFSNARKVLNCFWNLYSSLYSLCSGIKNFSLWTAACSDSGEWRKIERRRKMPKKGIGRAEGFFPFSPGPQHFFSAAFLCPVPTIWTSGIGFLALAESDVAVRKNHSKTMNVSR